MKAIWKRVHLLVWLHGIVFWGFSGINSKVQAQEGYKVHYGIWRSYQSFKHAKRIVSRPPRQVYFITDVGVGYYDGYGDYREWTRVEGLAEAIPTALAYDPARDYVIIGYQNGKIDYFRNNDLSDLKRIFDIYLAENFSSKQIHRVVPANGYWYIATDFGIVIYDPDKRETRLTVSRIDPANPEAPVYDIAYFHDSVWVGMGSGLWAAPGQLEKMLLPTSWRKVNGTGRLPNGAVYEVEASPKLLLCGVGDTTYMYHRDTMVWKPFIDTAHFYVGAPSSIQVVSDSFCVLTSKGNSAWFLIDPYNPIPYRKVWPIVGKDATLTPDQYGIGLATDNGLEFYHLPWWVLDTITPPSSFNTNSIGHIAVRDGILYLIPFGRYKWSQPSYQKDGVFIHNLRTDERWTINPRDSTYFQWGADNVAFNPVTGDVFVNSFGKGILVFQGKNVKQVFGPDEIPAPALITNQDTQYRVGYIQIDPQGTAWIPLWNGFSTNLLAYTVDGQWYSYSIGSGSDQLDVLWIDRYGTKWIRTNKGGIWVFHENGTLGNKSDDRLRLLSTATGQGALPSGEVNVVVEDRNGYIWVGTNQGGVVFYNPDAIFEGGIENDAVCPVLDYRCFLTYEDIRDIVVDGADRKWVATHNGVYFVSADGTQLIYHFTTENSPLPSDQVVDIALDPETGEVFFATDRGVVSFTNDATEPSTQPSKDLYVFPNPVPSSYVGPITIRGTGENAVVRITTIDGKLVRTLRSNGGQAIWDGTDSYGSRVVPGVYLIFVSDVQGEMTGATKVTILE